MWKPAENERKEATPGTVENSQLAQFISIAKLCPRLQDSVNWTATYIAFLQFYKPKNPVQTLQ